MGKRTLFLISAVSFIFLFVFLLNTSSVDAWYGCANWNDVMMEGTPEDQACKQQNPDYVAWKATCTQCGSAAQGDAWVNKGACGGPASGPYCDPNGSGTMIGGTCTWWHCESKQPPNSGQCGADNQTPNWGSTCTTCIANAKSTLVSTIRSFDHQRFDGCSPQQIVNYWCNGGVSPEGQTECLNNYINGVCKSSCTQTILPTSTPVPQAPTATPTTKPQAPTNTSVPPTPTNTPVPVTKKTVTYRVAETQAGLATAQEKAYDNATHQDPVTFSHTFSNSQPGLKTLWVRFKDNTGVTKDESLNITLSATACKSISIEGLSKVGINTQGGPVFQADSAGGNKVVNVDRTPSTSAVNLPATIQPDAGSASSAQPLTITTSNPGTGNVYIANIPANTDISKDNNYTLSASVGSGSSTASCLPATIKVSKGGIGQCTYSSTEVKLRTVETDPWLNEQTINKGEAVIVAGFHNNTTTGAVPQDIILQAVGPKGETVDITGNNTKFTPSQAGVYIINAKTANQQGSGCSGSATLTVNSTTSAQTYKIAESEAELQDAEAKPYDNFEHLDPITLPYTFKDQTPGLKKIFIEFNDGKKVARRTALIKLMFPAPKITSAKCQYDAITGVGTIITLRGSDFGTHSEQGQGQVLVDGTEAEIKSWNEEQLSMSGRSMSKSVLGATSNKGVIVAKIEERPTGTIPIELTIDDGRKAKARCVVNTTTLEADATLQCLKPGNFAKENVVVTVTEATSGAKPLLREKVSLDNEGVLQGFNPELEEGKEYILTIQAPQTLTRKVKFVSEEGTTILSRLQLLVGDIFGQGSAADGVVNAVDKAELARQWSLVSDVERNGDFNKDLRVNSVDYSCMRQNIGKSGDEIKL